MIAIILHILPTTKEVSGNLPMDGMPILQVV
jgi:hypothetical protein